jgi:hypothetical protein
MAPTVPPRRSLLFLACSIAALSPLAVKAQEMPFSNGLLYRLDAGTGVNLNGSAVTGWNDQTGNGYNFTQADAAKQPTLVPNVFGSYGAIRFDGDTSGVVNGFGPNADELILGTSSTVQTFVAVNRLAAGNGGLAGIWGLNDADTGIRRANSGAWQGTANGSNGDDFANGGLTLVNNSTSLNVAEGVPHILVAASTGTKDFASTSLGDYFHVGNNAPRSYKGDIAEILVFNRALSVPEAKQLTVYLAAKYQVSFGGKIYNVGGNLTIGTEDAGGLARYIRVHTDGTGGGGGNPNAFNISEMEVFAGQPVGSSLNPGQNLGLSSNGATFSTVSGGNVHGAEASVNNGLLESGGDVWTRDGVAEGLLDLGSGKSVGSVRLWNRPDCCGDRLAKFSISVEDANHNTMQSIAFPGQVGTFADFDFSSSTNKLTLRSSDLLAIELSALTNTGDRMRIGTGGTGTLALDLGASLNVVNLAGSFAPGQSFDILDFGSITGTFETINLPGEDSQWDLSKLYTTGQISVVPEPAAAGLLLAGALLGVRRRRATR